MRAGFSTLPCGNAPPLQRKAANLYSPSQRVAQTRPKLSLHLTMNLCALRRTLLILLPSFLVGASLGAEPATDPLEPGEKAAGAWITTRLETARLDSAWISEHPILQSTVKGLNERAGELEEKRDLIKATTAKDREEIDMMKAKNKAAADDLRIAETRLQALVAQLMELRSSLPPRLSEALELPYRSLGNPALATGERMQLVMTLLDRCAVFNRTVTCGEEVLSIDGDQGARSLAVIYWGLSHGYALDRAASKAWYGSPGPHGWQWETRPDAVPSVTRLIAIYNDRADPDFVSVPATLGQPLAGGNK